MRLAFVLLVACQQSKPAAPPPDPLAGDVACGTQTCHAGQACVTEHAGHQCWTDKDAGIGVYGTHAQYCLEVPAACHGVPSCDCMTCVNGGGLCSATARTLDCSCF